MAQQMTFEELLAHTQRQLDGVRKKASTIKDKQQRQPYENQIAGLEKKVARLEELLRWKEVGGEEPLLRDVVTEKGAAR